MNAMTKAHEIRKAAAVKFNCKVSEIHFGECLRMAFRNIGAMNEQQKVAEMFFLWAERDNKKFAAPAPTPALKPKSRADVVVLSDLGLDDAEAEAQLRMISDKESVEVIHLRNNDLSRIPENCKLFPNVTLINLDDNYQLSDIMGAKDIQSLESLSLSGAQLATQKWELSNVYGIRTC